MNGAMTAIIRKDFRAVTTNKHLLTGLLAVPIALTIVMPSIFLFMIHFAPEETDIQKMLEILPPSMISENPELTAARMVLNFVLPVFFLIIPVMAASIMAASSFVGEKEKHTLETLLYCPLSVKEIFRAKVIASFLLSMMVSAISFLAMILVLQAEAFFLIDSFLVPNVSWLIILLLVSPAVSLIAVTLIVRGSAKARSMEESQQSAVFLIIPIILLMVGQFAGLLIISVWIITGLGAACALIAWLLLKKCMSRFTYEMLLR